MWPLPLNKAMEMTTSSVNNTLLGIASYSVHLESKGVDGLLEIWVVIEFHGQTTSNIRFLEITQVDKVANGCDTSLEHLKNPQSLLIHIILLII